MKCVHVRGCQNRGVCWHDVKTDTTECMVQRERARVVANAALTKFTPHAGPLFIDKTRYNDLGYIQRINFAVAEHLFPHRTSATMFLKMYEEIGEIVKDPDAIEEVADVVIMLLDHIERAGGNLGEAILAKLERNLARKWKHDPRTGLFNHE